MKQMTRESVETLQRTAHTAIVKALKDAGVAGVEVSLAGGSWNTFEATLRFKFKLASSEAVVAKAEDDRAKFTRCAAAFGLPASAFGETFYSMSRAYVICGIKPERPKYPILARCVEDGKLYKFTAEAVRTRLAVQAASRGQSSIGNVVPLNMKHRGRR